VLFVDATIKKKLPTQGSHEQTFETYQTCTAGGRQKGGKSKVQRGSVRVANLSGYYSRRDNLGVVRILRHLDKCLFYLAVVIALLSGYISQVLNIFVSEIALVEQKVVVELLERL